MRMAKKRRTVLKTPSQEMVFRSFQVSAVAQEVLAHSSLSQEVLFPLCAVQEVLAHSCLSQEVLSHSLRAQEASDLSFSGRKIRFD